MSANLGNSFDWLFQALTEKMGILHTARPDNEPTQADRCEWKDKGNSAAEPIGYTIPKTATVSRQPVEYEVSVYGASQGEVLDRVGEIVGWLDFFVGPPQGMPPGEDGSNANRNGFKVGKRSPIAGGDGVSAGYSCTLEVTLYMPILSEVRPALLVGHPSVTATAQGSGDGPTNDGSVAWQG